MKQLKIFNGYSGSGVFAQIAQERGHVTTTCDADPQMKADIIVDMLCFDAEYIANNYDLVQLSPPCTTLSLASGNKHWDAEHNPKTLQAVLGKCHILHCLEILKACEKKGIPCFIENPNGRIVWFMPEEYKKVITYCSYGHDSMKLTNIYTNSTKWIPRTKCHNNNKECHHIPAPRGSKTGTQGKKDAYLRGILPIELCLDIIKAHED